MSSWGRSPTTHVRADAPPRCRPVAGAQVHRLARVCGWQPLSSCPDARVSCAGLGEVDAAPSAKQVFVAFIQDAERAGIAYYDTSEGALCATSVSCPLIDLPWVCQVLKLQVSKPTLIVTSSSVNTAVRDELAKPCDMGDAEGAAKPINVHIMKHTICECRALPGFHARHRVTLPCCGRTAAPTVLPTRVLL